MSQALFEKRRRAAWWRRLRQIALGLLVVGLVAGAIWTVWFSTLLLVTEVDVEGMTTLKPAAVRAQAEVPMGLQLARVDTVDIETRVARMERIDGVDVRRRWPHTVLIRVKERMPIAWVVSDGRIRYVDRNGVDFRTVSTEPKKLVEIRIGTEEPLDRQQALEAVTAVISFLRADARDVLAQVTYVSAASQDSVTLRLTNQRTVVWGSAEHESEKAEVLRPLLKRVDASRYDVSAPDLPTTKSTNQN
ncbi:MAG TPA: FtsQ-type POTRA domain-containing protein [Aeromicrobium sp.]|nr:FtsQ-type POTRA domain-containing protein [Aeromicrobium sp.]